MYVQAQMLDGIGPISDALKLLNAVNNESEEVKVDLDKKLGSTLEAAQPFLATLRPRPPVT